MQCLNTVKINSVHGSKFKMFKKRQVLTILRRGNTFVRPQEQRLPNPASIINNIILNSIIDNASPSEVNAVQILYNSIG